MDDQRKDHIDPKVPLQRNHSKQLQTNNVPTYDIENTNSANKGRDLFETAALRIVTKGLIKGQVDLEIKGRVETIQITALLRSARILRRVVETWGDLLSLQWKTPVKDHQLMLMWKNYQGETIIIIISIQIRELVIIVIINNCNNNNPDIVM